MNKSADSRTEATHDRLLDAALSLFAQRGVVATTVGDIETAAGLARRSGALYKYFESKDALLTACLERHLATVTNLEEELALQPLGEIRSELTLLGRWLMHELEVERNITHILEREGHKLGTLRDRMRTEISDRGYLIGAAVIGRWRPDLPPDRRDPMAVVIVGALINYKRSTWTLGGAPLALTEEQFIDEWVDICLTLYEPDRQAGPA